MAHASAHMSPCATRAQHHGDAAGSRGAGLAARWHGLSRPDGRLAPPPAMWAHRAVPLLRTRAAPPGVNGASRRVLGGISSRRTSASALRAPPAPSSKDAKQGRILLGVVGASYGASLHVQRAGQGRGCGAEWALLLRFRFLSEPTDAGRHHHLTPHTTCVQAPWRLRCASSSCCQARRCVLAHTLVFVAVALLLCRPAPDARLTQRVHQAASALSAVRGVMAAICFLPLAWHWRKQWKDLPPAFWAAACELALWNFLSQARMPIAYRAPTVPAS